MSARRIGDSWASLLCAAHFWIVATAGVGLGQTISNVEGTPSHGSSVTIRGTAFGTKPNPAPIKFDDFESGTPGQLVSGRAATVGGAWHTNSNTPYYSTVAAHSGNQGMTSDFTNGAYNSSLVQYSDFSAGFFIDAWYRYAPATPASRNNKLILVYGNGELENPQVHFAGFCNLSESMVFDSRATPQIYSMSYSGFTQSALATGELKHIQLWMKPSTPGQANGIIWGTLDGVVKADFNNVRSYAANGAVWNHVRVGYYMAHDGIPGLCEPAGNAYAYWDDVYIDNTQARVEVGNAATYSACTHREIQLPTAWSSNAVTISFNRGTFAQGATAYLFVVTADGNASAGHQITIGSGGTTTAPGQPGQPQLIPPTP